MPSSKKKQYLKSFAPITALLSIGLTVLSFNIQAEIPCFSSLSIHSQANENNLPYVIISISLFSSPKKTYFESFIKKFLGLYNSLPRGYLTATISLSL